MRTEPGASARDPGSQGPPSPTRTLSLSALIDLGATRGASATEQQRIRVANLMALLGVASYGVFALGYLVAGAIRFLPGVVINVLAVLSCFTILALSASGRNLAARYLVLVTANGHMALATWMFGPSVGYHYYFFGFATFPCLILPEGTWRSQALFSALSVGIFLQVEYTLFATEALVPISHAAARVVSAATAVLVFGMVITVVALSALDIARTQKLLSEKNAFIRAAFGRYLSDPVVTCLLETPGGLVLGGSRRKVTILMSDLRGFTTLCESMPSERIITLLNAYLGAMAEVITAHQGTIDEYIGDAILAIFGAPVQRPDDAERAVACAVAMQLAIDELNVRNASAGLPRLEMGIGVHTGEVVVGNIGSEKRSKYGVVGSPVNVTGRIEGYTVGGQVLVSETTAREVGEILSVRREMTVELKGVREPLRIMDVSGVGGSYALFLNTPEDAPRPMALPLAVECVALDGKHVTGPWFSGRFVALARRGAELCTDQTVLAASNLKVRMAHSEGASGEDFYLKVVSSTSADSPGKVVFTALPEGVAAHLENLYRQALQ